jgi:hypothetical protein
LRTARVRVTIDCCLTGRETIGTIMRRVFLTTVVALLCAGSAGLAADKAPQEAQRIRTVFVSKGSASSVLKGINAMHAKMEAEGWDYRDMGVYTEDGDLEGVFLTYVRASEPDAAPTTAPPAR